MTKINYHTDPAPQPGPGYARMRRRLGAAGAEALRQQVLAEQRAALERVQRERTPQRDRRTYHSYPPAT